jgi:hypothetical protein
MMIEEPLEPVVPGHPHFVRPRYDRYGYAQIPNTIRRLFGGVAEGIPAGPYAELDERYDAVVVVLIDAFGWKFVRRYAEHPFLKRIQEHGLTAMLSSQFPSTTAAHVTTIHTGLTPGESGVYEWIYYEPTLDQMIAPLLFSPSGTSKRELLQGTADADTLFPFRTIYHDLKPLKVKSTVFQSHVYAGSSYTRAVADGASVTPYQTVSEALVNLAALMAEQRKRTYAFLYIDSIDTICHRYGPDSPQTEEEILSVLSMLERVLHQRLSRVSRRTLLLITADHGQTAIDPATTIYLNRTLPALTPLLRTNQAGLPLVPAGSARDLFLYVRDEALDEAQGMLFRHLEGRAEVWRVADLIEQGYFGPPGEMFRSRVGNLVVLPYPGESVWWYERGRFEQRFYGSHGGLTRNEMETTLLALSYSQ